MNMLFDTKSNKSRTDTSDKTLEQEINLQIEQIFIQKHFLSRSSEFLLDNLLTKHWKSLQIFYTKFHSSTHICRLIWVWFVKQLLGIAEQAHVFQ